MAAGLVPQARDGEWDPAAVAQARVVARLRERGHSIDEIRRATAAGRLAFGYVEELLPSAEPRHTLEEAARDTRLEPALIRRIYAAMGFNAAAVDHISDADLDLLRHVAEALAAGFPLVALLQLVRVYGQALTQMADAGVRLFHLYMHEPLMRESVPVIQIAEEMADLAEEVLPLAAPVMDHVHQRFLAHFIEQDVVGHMEAEVDGAALDLGRLRVAIAFADLAGYTRLTEEEGEEEAVSAVGGLHRERRAHAPAPPDRDPLRRRHLPRWRLLRQRRQPGVARCGAIGGRRGHRHAAGRRGGGLAPEVHAWARCG